MRGMNSACVDLIYLDPPFNSKANYAAPIGSAAAGAAFKDTWTLSDIDAEWLDEIEPNYPQLWNVIMAAMTDSDKSYLVYMAIRLLEMKRILKKAGSVYLHCDPTMSHYLKLVMDAVFGRNNFVSDVVWPRYAPHSLAKSGMDTITDHILVYAAESANFKGKLVTEQLPEKELKKKLDAQFQYREVQTGRWFETVALEQRSNYSSAGEVRTIQGREVVSDIGWRWTQKTFDRRLAENPNLIYWTAGGRPRYKKYRDEYRGRPVGNLWTDIPYLSSCNSERTGYPTQKPLALLSRIIQAASKPDDLVLDPFCGCATTCVAADGLDRNWVGIDISPKAAQLVVNRIEQHQGLFPDINHRMDVPQRTDLGPLPKYNCDANKAELYGMQGGDCAGCNEHFKKQHLEVDHRVAKTKGGTDHMHNLQLLCGHCNKVKGNRGMPYLRKRLRLAA